MCVHCLCRRGVKIMATEQSGRLVRLLNLLPYVSRHQDKTLMEIARDLNMDVAEVRDDLDRLHLSGVGRGPGEMFDLAHTWRGVTVLDDQGLNAPLRLKPTEAHALLLLLESLETLPGLVNVDAVRSAADKIRAVTHTAGVTDVEQLSEGTPVAATISEAIAAGKKLELRYYSATSDQLSQRTVSPISVLQRDEQTYLRALEDDTQKTFRFDRIREIHISAQAVDERAVRTAADVGEPFAFDDGSVARFKVRGDALWMAEYWELELELVLDQADQPPEWVDATLRYGSDDWLARFCLAHADRLRLVAPEDLATKVRERALRAADALR